jgi:hypothetical protein
LGESVAISRASSRVFNPSSVLFKASMRLASPASTPLSSASVAFKASILLFNPSSVAFKSSTRFEIPTSTS